MTQPASSAAWPLAGTLTELVDALRTKQVSPTEVLTQVFDRIDAHNGTLNAVVSMADRETALAEARAAGERIAKGAARPLEGVPLGVKDLEDVAGMVTTFGSVPYKDNVAARDATQTARLRAAGAIPMAKTNTPEWGASGVTNNRLFGATRNPWDAERSPGGSSGGAAAAIASSMLPLATASDGGGSVRIPACWVGAFGLKTSFGRIPAGPGDMWDYPKIGVAGPLTKTVADAALVLDQVAGPSPYDPASLPHPGYRYADVAAAPLAGPLRIGVCVEWGSVPVQSDIAAAVEDGAKLFEKLGHDVRTLVLNPPDATEAWLSMSAFQHASRLGPKLDEHAGEWGEEYGQYVRTMTSLTAEQGGRMLRARNALVRWCAELFDEIDLLLTPTVAFDPPPAAGPFPTEIEGRATDPLTVAAFVMPFNSTWNPAANVRSGISKAGFPMGMQIVGPQHRDDLVLQAAQAFEAERPWHPHWPEPQPVSRPRG